MSTIPVLKTYKLFIDGAYPRTESGRYYSLKNKAGTTIANVCLSSRKDFRNAIVAARKAQDAWQGRAAFNKAQIIYRIGEILQGRATQFVQELIEQGLSKAAAQTEVHHSIEACIHFAGWADKYQAITSSVNPVATSHFNFSVPEPMGVVSIIIDEPSALCSLVVNILSAIVGGNTVVVLAHEAYPLSAITFAEVLSTSDVPNGIVNILTGKVSELHKHMSNHMDVNAVVYVGKDANTWRTIAQEAAINVKRSYQYNLNFSNYSNFSLHHINNLQEIKTTWHPIEKIGIGGAKY
jgi:acyl-CoA reductase-like NAD-dependent aldehyde dehydrogenase